MTQMRVDSKVGPGSVWLTTEVIMDTNNAICSLCAAICNPCCARCDSREATLSIKSSFLRWTRACVSICPTAWRSRSGRDEYWVTSKYEGTRGEFVEKEGDVSFALGYRTRHVVVI
jgi:hypothetical protein